MLNLLEKLDQTDGNISKLFVGGADTQSSYEIVGFVLPSESSSFARGCFATLKELKTYIGELNSTVRYQIRARVAESGEMHTIDAQNGPFTDPIYKPWLLKT